MFHLLLKRTEVPLEVIERESKRIIVVVTHEMTGSRETESGPLEDGALFRIFFERSADAISLLDRQTLRYIEANEAVARLLGAPSRDALRKASPVERWPERQSDGRFSVEKAREMVELALTQGSQRFGWLSCRYDASELPLDIVITAVPFGERTIISRLSRPIEACGREVAQVQRHRDVLLSSHSHMSSKPQM
jgi:PAS domain-containing protein